jgi:hypothetical protein
MDSFLAPPIVLVLVGAGCVGPAPAEGGHPQVIVPAPLVIVNWNWTLEEWDGPLVLGFSLSSDQASLCKVGASFPYENSYDHPDFFFEYREGGRMVEGRGGYTGSEIIMHDQALGLDSRAVRRSLPVFYQPPHVRRADIHLEWPVVDAPRQARLVIVNLTGALHLALACDGPVRLTQFQAGVELVSFHIQTVRGGRGVTTWAVAAGLGNHVDAKFVADRVEMHLWHRGEQGRYVLHHPGGERTWEDPLTRALGSVVYLDHVGGPGSYRLDIDQVGPAAAMAGYLAGATPVADLYEFFPRPSSAQAGS